MQSEVPDPADPTQEQQHPSQSTLHQDPSSRPSRSPGAESSTRRVNGGAMPLITDDPSASAGQHSWEVLESHPGLSDDTGDTIPWILRGTNDAGKERAQALIEKAIQDAKVPRHTGYLILPDPRSYRFVVGPGGSSINAVRRKTGCKVDVPKNNAGGEAIEVQGQKDKVEQAKDLILEFVRQGEAGAPTRRG